MFKVNAIHSYIRDRENNNTKIGVIVAMELDENLFGINYSICNPGKTLKNGKVVDKDKFDAKFGYYAAIGKILCNASQIEFKHNTSRAVSINDQIEDFKMRAQKYFKNKSYVSKINTVEDNVGNK